MENRARSSRLHQRLFGTNMTERSATRAEGPGPVHPGSGTRGKSAEVLPVCADVKSSNRW